MKHTAYQAKQGLHTVAAKSYLLAVGRQKACSNQHISWLETDENAYVQGCSRIVNALVDMSRS
jgi:hypothetical protein